MYKKILVPLDSSPLAEQALPVALHLAEKLHGELLFLSVVWQEPQVLVEPMGYGIYLPEATEVNIREELDCYLQQLVNRCASPSFLIRTLIREGDEAGMIVDTAVSENVDLIVMSTHGRSGVTRWLMGSVTEKVLHQAPCPILISRGESVPDQLIVTLDGSELGETALLPGLALSLALNAEITLLQVDDGSLPPLPPSLVQQDQTESSRLPSNDLYLQAVADRFSHHPMKTAVVAGKPAEAILDFAKSRPNSLIIMSTHGRTGLARWVFGSVAEKVVRGSVGSVLVIRPPANRLK